MTHPEDDSLHEVIKKEPSTVLSRDELVIQLGLIYIPNDRFTPIPISDEEFKKKNPGYQIVSNQG
jgi:hypothetical protein